MMRNWGRVALVVGLILVTGTALGAMAMTREVAPNPPTDHHLLLLTGVCVLEDSLLVHPASRTPTVAIALPMAQVPCPAIIYNPGILGRVPPGVAMHILLHEYAHIAMRHSRVGRTPAEVRQMERDADCRAAMIVQQRWPHLVPELVQFWEGAGPEDDDHDSGSDRATLIAKCASRA